jgi:lysylphosphatidylglycerol synthetase-like protein (DUF2156 family)
MSNLTDENIEFIAQIINGSKIESAEMKEDLIDHFCCAIEEEMGRGLSFKKSYDKAYQNICPDGFDEIHRETVFLLTFKKIKAMKRLLYVSGYLSAIGVTTTIFMKLNHFGKPGITFLLTSAILIFLFVPSLFVNLYKRDLAKSLSNKLIYAFGFIGVELLVVFALFRLNHWSWSTSIFLTSFVILNFAFFPLLFFKMYRKSVL